MPVRTSSPSSSPPGTRSPAWPGRTRPRRRCPRSARRCVAAASRISTGSRRRPRTPTASSTSRTGKTCFRPAGWTPWPPRSSRSCSRTARHSREPESRWSRRAASARPANLGRPATEEDPALPSGDEHKGTLRVRNVVERAVVGLAERGVRSSIVRLPPIAHSTTDSAGFLPGLIALAKEKGFAGYPGDGANLWGAVHIRDVASLFRLALEKGPAGRYWHASRGRGHPVPRDRRGHRQPSGPARREHSRGRPDAAGILRASSRIWSR